MGEDRSEHIGSPQQSKFSHEELLAIFDSIDMPVYISDPNSYEILYVNKEVKKIFGSVEGQKCYETFQGQKIPCSFCTNSIIFNQKPGEPYIWEFQNMRTKRWYHCIDKVIPWPDGRQVRLEMALDITEEKTANGRLEKLNEELIRSNRIFKQLALKDSHTGLYNHRYISEVIEAEFLRAKRYAHPLSAILMDIDYFKSINDVYGREFGDLILKQVARQLKLVVRQYDVVVRLGGEEFVVLSPATNRSDALGLAERILEAITLYDFGDKDHSVKLKVSIAVASYPEDKVSKGMGLIDIADQILNKVKEYGGNRVYSSQNLKPAEGLKPDADAAERATDIKTLKKKLEKLTKQANQGLVESVFAFAKTIELKDHYTGEHVEKTVHYATEVAREMGLSKEDIDRIRQAAVLHDLGKIGISEKILLKKGKLTKREFDEIKKHPQIAVDILRPIQSLQGVVPLIYYHHERWDGKGYSSGLKGDEIPVGARIIAVSDVYEALTSDRPYRKAYSREEAIRIVKSSSGTQFDPHVVDAFLKVLQQEK